MKSKMSKLKKSLLCAALAAVCCSSFAGCSFGKVATSGSNSDTVLDVYILWAGYRTAWLDPIKDAFVKQDWVKEKYGDVKVNVTSNDLGTYATDRIKNGAEFDLYFGQSLRELYLEDYNRQPVCEDLTDLLGETVPGEDITFGDKLLPGFQSSCRFVDDRGNVKYYSVPYAAGMTGIYYNHDLLEEYNIDVPLTTDQFKTACDTITEGEGYAIMSSATQAPYWVYLYSTFWGQYEGVDKYREFFSGTIDGKLAETGKDLVLSQTGMLRSMEALEGILSGNHLIDTANSLLFMQAQTNFITGRGAFMAAGDWFDMEMYQERTDRIEAGQTLPTVSMMRTPVISSIVEKLSYRDEDGSYMDDTMLQELIKDVDAGKESPTNTKVSQDDYDIVREARNVVYSIGPGHNAVIPSYSPAKELAKDFLLYMATDEACTMYFENTQGAQLPFRFDAKTICPDVYAEMPLTGQMRCDFYAAKEGFSVSMLPYEGEFPLVIYGGISAMPGNVTSFEIFFGSKATEDRRSPETLYKGAQDNWAGDRWQMALENAGLI